MKMNMNIDQAYAEFGFLMAEEEIYADPKVDFQSVCTRIGCSPEALDEMIIREMGMTGTELMEAYREQLEGDSR